MDLNTILFIGDTHVGSKYGIWPKGRMPTDSTSQTLRRVSYINECYAELLHDLPEIDLTIVMGDVIDGKQKKSEGVPLFTSSLDEQVEAAEELYKPLRIKSKRIFRVHGTPYHEEFHNALRAFDKTLEVERVDYVLDLVLSTGILNVAHHPSGGSALYRGTQVDKELVWAAMAAFEHKVITPRWIVRAHKHHYIKQDTEHMTVIGNPCFQLPTPYAIKQQYWRFQSTFGATLMRRDPEERGGYRFLPLLYESPMREVIDK